MVIIYKNLFIKIRICTNFTKKNIFSENELTFDFEVV